MLKKTLESPLDNKEIKPINLKEINTEFSLKGLMLKLKLQYFGHLKRWLIEKDPDAGKDWKQKENMTDEMVRKDHQLNGQEFEQTLWDSEGPGSLACCSEWSHKESDTTERLNWTELIIIIGSIV